MADNRFFPLAAAQQNLKRLLLIRLIVFICQAIALLIAWSVLSLELSYNSILSVMLLILLVNACVFYRITSQPVIHDLELLIHLLFDVLSLSLLLYFGGGANNPFVSFFLVPITISAAILPWAYTWIVAGTSVVTYTILLFYYNPLPALMPADMAMSGSGGTPNLHIIGMWINFFVSAMLITYFVVKMAVEIRSRELVLNKYREENLRDEQILAVATQAAGTAHELGTPLNTMALLVREMSHDHKGHAVLEKDLATLETQLAACKHSLKSLVERADLKNANLTKTTTLKVFLDQILDQWRLLRPEVTLNISISGPGEFPAIEVDTTLQQAVVNILNNAADASQDAFAIEIEAGWSDSIWFLSIRDFGEGINKEIIQYLGSEIISDKDKGLGVGMILSQASINRLGGTVMMTSHPEQGTVTEIKFPLSIERA